MDGGRASHKKWSANQALLFFRLCVERPGFHCSILWPLWPLVDPPAAFRLQASPVMATEGPSVRSEKEKFVGHRPAYLFLSFRRFSVAIVDAVGCGGRVRGRRRSFLVESAEEKVQFIVEYSTFVTDRLAVLLLRLRFVGRHLRDEFFDRFAQHSAEIESETKNKQTNKQSTQSDQARVAKNRGATESNTPNQFHRPKTSREIWNADIGARRRRA